MTLLTRKNLVVLALVLLYVVSGFFREFAFINLNEQRRVIYNEQMLHQATENHVVPSMQWLSSISYNRLNDLKWVLTLLFAVYFAALAAFTVRIAFRNKNFVRLTWIIFGAVFLTGLVFYLFGWMAGNVYESGTYAISRFFAGLTETPGLLVILLGIFLAMERQNDQ
jgi:hypothetical protein